MKFSAEWRVRRSECGTARQNEHGFTPQSVLRIPHSKGFTLLEIMVAVAILGLVIVSLLGLRNRSLQDVLLAGRITTATMLAEREMADMLSRPLVPLEEEGEFEEEEEFRGFTWKKIVAPTPIPTLPAIMEVRVAVLWREGEREEMVELVSYE